MHPLILRVILKKNRSFKFARGAEERRNMIWKY